MSVQWAHLGAVGVLVATDDGAWTRQPEFGAFGLDDTMPDELPATADTTRHLLDGAIATAAHAAPEMPEPPMTAVRWAWNLVSQWHCAHHSVALLPDAIDRYEAAGRPDLAEFARRKLDEEAGHDQLPLNDLRALGYDARPLVHAVPPAPTVTAGLEYAGGCIAGEQPVEFLGYVYALERRILQLSDDSLAALDAVLPPGVDATSGVRLHSNDLDIGHVDEAVAFVSGLPAEDRTAIAIGCYRTTEICCAALPGRVPPEAELERWLVPFRRAQAMSGASNGNQNRGGGRGPARNQNRGGGCE